MSGAVADPDATRARCDVGRCRPDRKRLDERSRARVDDGDRLGIPVHHPDPSVGHRDAGRAVTYSNAVQDAVRPRIDDGDRVSADRDDTLLISAVAGQPDRDRGGCGCGCEEARTDDSDHEGASPRPARHRGCGPRGRIKLRILLENRALEVLQLPAWLQSELLVESAPALLVGGERLRLAAGSVEALHQLGTQALAERILADEGLELGEKLRVAAEGQLGIGPLLAPRGLAKLLETSDLRLREALVGDVVERRSSPETEGVVECRCRSLWITRGEQLSPAL